MLLSTARSFNIVTESNDRIKVQSCPVATHAPKLVMGGLTGATSELRYQAIASRAVLKIHSFDMASRNGDRGEQMTKGWRIYIIIHAASTGSEIVERLETADVHSLFARAYTHFISSTL